MMVCRELLSLGAVAKVGRELLPVAVDDFPVGRGHFPVPLLTIQYWMHALA